MDSTTLEDLVYNYLKILATYDSGKKEGGAPPAKPPMLKLKVGMR